MEAIRKKLKKNQQLKMTDALKISELDQMPKRVNELFPIILMMYNQEVELKRKILSDTDFINDFALQVIKNSSLDATIDNISNAREVIAGNNANRLALLVEIINNFIEDKTP